MEWLEKIVDETLAKMSKEDILMKVPDPDMPKEMFDSSVSCENDWKGWKAIKSVFNDSDLNRLERILGIKLPISYRYFLMYKHFYQLSIPDFAVNLHTHLPDENLDGFKEFLYEYEPESLIEKGLIYFADFQDYGLLCFDSTEKRENNDYPIVYIDHEELSIKHHYANNFKEMLLEDRERGNRFVLELNEYYKQ